MNSSELSAVFDICQPNPQGLISLEKLEQLFDNHNADVQVWDQITLSSIIVDLKMWYFFNIFA